QSIRAIGVEAEEPSASRTNVLIISLSADGGRTYQERIRQEFNFSPGTTFEREEWSVPAERITHVRLVIQPDKGHAPYRATLTSLTVRSTAARGHAPHTPGPPRHPGVSDTTGPAHFPAEPGTIWARSAGLG